MTRKQIDYGEMLSWQVTATGLLAPAREFVFHPTRKWRLDLAWPGRKIAVEIEGGVWTGGRHTNPAGFLGDVEKYNQAVLLGWALYRVTPDMVKNGQALKLIEQAMRRIEC